MHLDNFRSLNSHNASRSKTTSLKLEHPVLTLQCKRRVWSTGLDLRQVARPVRGRRAVARSRAPLAFILTEVLGTFLMPSYTHGDNVAAAAGSATSFGILKPQAGRTSPDGARVEGGRLVRGADCSTGPPDSVTSDGVAIPKDGNSIAFFADPSGVSQQQTAQQASSSIAFFAADHTQLAAPQASSSVAFFGADHTQPAAPQASSSIAFFRDSSAAPPPPPPPANPAAPSGGGGDERPSDSFASRSASDSFANRPSGLVRQQSSLDDKIRGYVKAGAATAAPGAATSFNSGINYQSRMIRSQHTVSNLLAFSGVGGVGAIEDKEAFKEEVLRVRKRLVTISRRTLDPSSRFVKMWDLCTLCALVFVMLTYSVSNAASALAATLPLHNLLSWLSCCTHTSLALLALSDAALLSALSPFSLTHLATLPLHLPLPA